MKNIILSIIIVGIVVGGGYYFFENKKSPTDDMVKVSLDAYNNSDEKDIKFEDGSEVTPSSQLQNNSSVNSGEVKKTHMVTVETNYGKIVFETYDSDAPKTVNNFVTLAGKGFYNGLTFHRVIKGFMIQGGDPNGNGTGGPGYQFEDELNPNTDSYKAGYKKGVVAMANAGPNTNGSQFFIMTADYPLPNAYTIFGKVVSGQDIVDKIANLPTGANDRPVSPVTMTKVTVE